MDKKMRDAISHAKQHVEYYKNSLKDIEIEKVNIEDVPILKKDYIQNNTKAFISDEYNIEQMTIEFTSGSTGKNLVLYKTKEEIAKTNLLLLKSRRKIVKNIHRIPIVKFYGITEDLIQEPIYIQDNTINISLLDLSPRAIELYWNTISKYEAVWIFGPPSAVYKMALYILKSGKTNQSIVKYIELTGEVLMSHQRQLIEDVFGCPVRNHYGCREFWCIAFECMCNKLHIYDNEFYVEIIDKNGNPAKNGEYGEIVVTSLYKMAMPLIRYKIGDYGRLVDIHCECGNQSTILDLSGGRVTDYMVGESGETINSIVIAVIVYKINKLLFDRDKIIQFQVKQRSVCEFEASFVVQDVANTSKMEQFFYEELKTYIGKNLIINFNYVDDIDQDPISGKYKYFYSYCN